MSDHYKLNVKNNSKLTGSFCVYQEAPDTNIPGLLTLAWLTETVHPTSWACFQWQIDHWFVWSHCTRHNPETTIKSDQEWRANLSTLNQVVFDYTDASYTFNHPTQGEQEGNLYIKQTKRVMANDALVGIGMAGQGTFVVPSEPNTTVIMTPKAKPKYWLVFGDYTTGQSLDLAKISDQAYAVEFDDSGELTVEFTAENKWKTIPKKEVSQACA